MKKQCLLNLSLIATFIFIALNASAMSLTTLELDKEITLKAPFEKLDKATAPRLLYARYNYSYTPYVKVYRFKVEPGRRYTFYMFHAAKGVNMNAYLRGDNPLSDYTSSYGPSGYMRGFVSWGQQPYKTDCPYRTRRFNLTISTKSEHPWLYLVCTYAKPKVSFKVLLKSKADDDTEVEKDLVDPSCSKRKGYHWGSVWKKDFLLTKIPNK